MRKIDLYSEKNFENNKQRNLYARADQKKFYWAVEIPTEIHNKRICKKIKGKNILEIGCSHGELAILYSKYFKSYLGLDISDLAINNAKSLKLNSAKFICCDAHNLPAESESFDCVIVNSLLHHLDLQKVLKEIHRVLKNDGYLIFKEPLGINPIFEMYRRLSPSARTADERPLKIQDIKLMKKYFYLNDIKYFGFLNIISAFLKLKFLRRILTIFDIYLSKTFMKFFFWQIAGFAKKY